MHYYFLFDWKCKCNWCNLVNNGNALHFLVKRQRLSDWIKKQKTCSHKHLNINAHHSSLIHNSLKLENLQSPPTGKWWNKLWYIHIKEWHSKIKRNQILLDVTTWMNLKIMILSERSQTPKITYCMIPFLWHSRGDNTVVIQAAQWFLGARHEGKNLTVKGQEELSGVMEMICIFIVVVVTWLYTLIKIHQTAHLKYGSFYCI